MKKLAMYLEERKDEIMMGLYSMNPNTNSYQGYTIINKEL